jgi:hypothetical protein
MLIPEATATVMDQTPGILRRYHAALMEPWDGPAAVCFTDGRRQGNIGPQRSAPCAFLRSKDDIGIASLPESGVLRRFRRTSSANGVCSRANTIDLEQAASSKMPGKAESHRVWRTLRF